MGCSRQSFNANRGRFLRRCAVKIARRICPTRALHCAASEGYRARVTDVEMSGAAARRTDLLLTEGTPDARDDHELMTRIAQGDRAALGALVERHQQGVLSLAYRFLGRWDLAEDICQDAFIRILDHAGEYQPSARFSTWLYRVVANLCWDRRRRARHVRHELTTDIPASGAAHAAPDVGASDVQERVRQAIAALPDRQRLAVILHRFHEMSHAEVAQLTGWSASAVESCLVRAYDQLRCSLADVRGP